MVDDKIIQLDAIREQLEQAKALKELEQMDGVEAVAKTIGVIGDSVKDLNTHIIVLSEVIRLLSNGYSEQKEIIGELVERVDKLEYKVAKRAEW
ncbi:hypothetical protein ACF3NL_02925 [Dolosigranulum pigrum]|uniref:hypothetical protein n=1 Tax=Dolosigranulum pigrum TaxID=29394 RepID=UPI000DC4C8D4|nr:hypothetical protein [Dolosigranulum pigrum]RAN53534.1 hypothetical protein B8A31_02830 [Dolosigranulum pigrum]